MAVAYDAVGPSSSGQVSATTSITWTHTAGTGGSVILVYLTVGVNASTTLGTFSGVTYGGASMTLLGTQEANGSGTGEGGIFCYGITGGANGANTVSATYSSSTDLQSIIGVSVSFTGAGGFGTAVTSHSSGAGTSGAVTISSTTSGNVCAVGVCDGSGGETLTAPSGVAQRWKQDNNTDSAAGCTIGGTVASPGGSCGFTWSQNSDEYGAIAVEVQVPAAGVGPPLSNMPVIGAVVLGSRAGWLNAGHSR